MPLSGYIVNATGMTELFTIIYCHTVCERVLILSNGFTGSGEHQTGLAQQRAVSSLYTFEYYCFSSSGII